MSNSASIQGTMSLTTLSVQVWSCLNMALVFKQGVKIFRPFFKLISEVTAHVSDVISLSLQEKMAGCSTHA